MSNINELKPIISLNPFARFCCTIGNLPSSYMASLTYEEQLLWFCDFLQNTVIPAVNNNAECVKELQELYVKLKNYVDNYFKNLNVQDEINHKLDEMAQDGSLNNIFQPYLQNFENDINTKITIQNNKINSLEANQTDFENDINTKITIQNNKINSLEANQTEIVDDTSLMIDTNKIYILSNNMHIFYYKDGWIDSNVVYGSISNIMKGNFSTLATTEQWETIDYDFNNLLPNKIYVINPQSTIDFSLIKNCPITDLSSKNLSGTLISYSYRDNSITGCTQIYVTINGDIYYRTGWGNNQFLPWNSVYNNVQNLIDNSLLNDNSKLFSSFKCYGIIGDSLSSGECTYGNDNDTHYIDLYDISWGQFLARQNGNKALNFSKGGLTTRSWFTDTKGYNEFIKPENLCDCYIIALGVNDSSKLGIEYLGNSSDINLDNKNLNNDSYYGNYGKIIQSIKEIQPKAKIFCLTNPLGISGNSLQFNNAIRDMENIFTENVYVIDLTLHYDYYNSEYILSQKRGGHYNAVAYQNMATNLNKWISEYMRNNESEFRQIEFIGTDYNWDFS